MKKRKNIPLFLADFAFFLERFAGRSVDVQHLIRFMTIVVDKVAFDRYHGKKMIKKKSR